MFQPNFQQTAGAVGGAGYSLWEAYHELANMVSSNPEYTLIKSAIIGATVGFIVTTLLRLAWDNIVAKYGKRFKWLKPKK